MVSISISISIHDHFQEQWSVAYNYNWYFVLQFAVIRAGGSPYQSSMDRQIYMQATHVTESQSTRADPEELTIVPDDGIVKYTVMPDPTDNRVKVRVSGDTMMMHHSSELFRFRTKPGTFNSQQARN